jgi:CPA2 family monovalent cation:H+ antiporter-2
VLIGPATPGFVADQSLASELAEIGVILLMFGVGLHFSLDQLLLGEVDRRARRHRADRLRHASRHGAGVLARLVRSARASYSA